jgi:hypothetical protein
MTILLFALLLTAATPEAPLPPPAEFNPRTMNQREIRAHNANLARDDAEYIRCIRSADTGSLIARNYSCRTNRQWVAADEAGNAEARVIADEMRSKSWATN